MIEVQRFNDQLSHLIKIKWKESPLNMSRRPQWRSDAAGPVHSVA